MLTFQKDVLNFQKSLSEDKEEGFIKTTALSQIKDNNNELPVQITNSLLNDSNITTAPPTTTTDKSQSTYIHQFSSWFKQDWPMKIGWLVFILWVWRFLSYAIQNNRISPAMRIALGIIASIIMIWLGQYSLSKKQIQWSYLMWLWSAIYVLSIYIGYKFFWFFSIPLGLVLIAIQYSVMAYFSYKANNHRINDVSLFFSMICPFIFSDGSWNIVWLFSYLSVHLLGSAFVSYLHNRSASRLMGWLFLWIYNIIWLLSSDGVMWSPLIVGMISLLVIILSFVEIYIGKVKRTGFSTIQLFQLWVLWVLLFAYMSVLTLTNDISGELYTSVIMSFFLAYGLLWYFYSINNSQNAYSALIWTLSVLYLLWVAYYQLSGSGLFLSTILISAIVQIIVLIITKKPKYILRTGIIWAIPISMLIFLYDWYIHINNYYLSCLYTRSLLCWVIAYLCKKYSNDTVKLLYTIAWLSLFYFALCNSIDGYIRIIALLWVSLLRVFIWYISKINKQQYTMWLLITLLLPSLYLYVEWVSKNLSLFAFFIAIAWIALLWVFFTRTPLETKETPTEKILWDYWVEMLIVVWLLYIYLSVLYIIPNQYYTLSYTILSMFFYLVGTRYDKTFGDNKILYTSIIIVPLLVSIWLFDLNNNFVVILSSLILSISLLWLRFDNATANNLFGYIFYAFGLFYFRNFWYVSSKHLTNNASLSIAIMLIVFTIIWIVFYIYGKIHENKEYSNIWAAVIIWVTGRVLVVELRNMSLIMRIATCLAIGWLLIGSWFIGNKKKLTIKTSEKL